MGRKTFRAPIELKADGEEGTFRSVFARFNVIDLDGDVTRPGAFEDGQEVVVEGWNHDYGLPPGKGVIHSDDQEAWIDGAFFVDTTAGRDHYLTLKALGGLEEWSYTFDIERAEQGDFEEQGGQVREVRFLDALDVWGVAPVTRGAGIGTRTLSLKTAGLAEDDIKQLKALLQELGEGVKSALPSHSTETTDADWDAGENERRARSDEEVAYYRRIYAWRDPEGDEGVKSTYKFPHHMVSGDGAPGAANVRACQAGIGVLNGARGGADIPAGDRQGVYNHLARHLRDADMEPAELKGVSAGGGEGETEGEGPGGPGADGNQSGVYPSVVLAQIEIVEIE